MGLDVLKSYLVSLGFGVDNPSFSKFKKALTDSEKAVEASTSGMTKEYVKAAGVITSALTSIGIATIGLLDKVAQTDLEYQKFAMHMFMSRDAAKELKIATDALGESLDDIAWNPELRQRYYALMREARQMETPKDAEAQLKYIRDIRFEFTRLKVEATYGMQWIGYYLFKYLAGPIKDIREGMAKLNDWLQARMPEWTDKVAQILTTFINLGRSAWRAITDIFGVLKSIWDMLPPWAQGVALAFAVAFTPVSPALKILSALILLVDDFYAFIDGRKSSKGLAPIWDSLLKTTDAIRWNLVLMTRLAENFFASLRGGGKSYSSIMSEVQEEWKNSLQKRLGDRYRDYGADNKFIPAQADITKAHAAGLPMSWSNPSFGDSRDKSFLSSFLNSLKYGVQNYQGLMASSLTPSLAGGGTGDVTMKVDIGGVEVHVNQPNATPKEIYQTTKQAIQDALGASIARNTRDLAGSY